MTAPTFTPPRPCTVCGRPTPQGAGVIIGLNGPRVCIDELARPLEELTALLSGKGK